MLPGAQVRHALASLLLKQCPAQSLISSGQAGQCPVPPVPNGPWYSPCWGSTNFDARCLLPCPGRIAVSSLVCEGLVRVGPEAVVTFACDAIASSRADSF